PPKPGPTAATRSGLVDSVEAIEPAVAMLQRYAGPGVDALDGRPGPPVPHDDADASAAWRILDGVVHQIHERLPDHEAICPRRDGPRRFDGERLLLFLGEDTEMCCNVASQLGEIDGLTLERHVAPVGPRQREQPFHHPSEAVRLLQHAADDLAIRRRITMLPQSDLADASHRRQRGPKLM